ncbi:MAG: hypothetical protein ACI9W4_000028 [Rhodothermales bacterium]
MYLSQLESTGTYPVTRLLSLFALSALLAPASLAQPVSQPFTFNLQSHSMPAVRNAAVAWGDIDNDGDLDAFVSGRSDAGLTAAVYRNDGSGENGTTFTPLAGGVRAVAYSRSSWADIDGDGDLDLAVSGSTSANPPYAPLTAVYRNNGDSFVDIGADLPAYHSGALGWADTDNDGDLDLLVTGVDAAGAYQSSIAVNAGGSFTATPAGIPGFAYGQAKWGDYDNDGDPDLLISGATPEGFRTSLYRTSGGVLTDLVASFAPLAFSSVDWGDYDADGDLDIVVSGGQVTPRIFEGQAVVYRNTNGSFQAVETGIQGSLAGAITWGDYDNDGDLDLLSLGAESALGRRTARVYRNSGQGNFEQSTYLVGAIFAAADWGDFDGDGDLDLLSAGATSGGSNILNLYANERQVRPETLSAPSALRSIQADGVVALEWTDTRAGVVTYDLRIGTAPGLADVRSAPSDPVSGLRRVARPGFLSTTSTYLQNLAPGRYFWSVQSVGATFSASAFSSEGSFDVSATATGTDDEQVPTSFRLRPPYPNPFSQQARIDYDVPAVSTIQIRVFDMLGRQVGLLLNTVQAPGAYSIGWDAPAHLAGGIYLLEMRAGSYRDVKTLTLVR